MNLYIDCLEIKKFMNKVEIVNGTITQGILDKKGK